jgi:hypothetical protein
MPFLLLEIDNDNFSIDYNVMLKTWLVFVSKSVGIDKHEN